METLVQMEAFAEVTEAMQKGWQYRTLDQSGQPVTVRVPFSDLSRPERIGLLNGAVDWRLYSQFGLRPEHAWQIVSNAASLQPPDRWLEPAKLEHRTDRTTLNDIRHQCHTQRPRIVEAERSIGHER